MSENTPNEVTSADGGWRIVLAFVAQWPATAEFIRWAAKDDMRSRYHLAFRFRAILVGLAFFCSAMFASQADVSAPIHDWTVHVGNGDYGVTSWVPGHWDMYLGSRVEPGASVAFQYSVVLSLYFFSGITACSFAILSLRTFAPRRQPNNAAAGKAGLAPLFAVERHCPGLPEPERWTKTKDK